MTQGETFGAVLAVVASVVSNLGVNIQKFSHAQDSQLPDVDQRPYIQRPLWWIGLSFVIFGSLGDFTAFGFATQSLVAALGGGSTLVANVIAAYFLNKESLYLTDLGGIIFVIAGVVLIAFIAEPNTQYPLPELELRFVRREFVIYIVIVGVLIVSMLATIKGSVAHRLKNQMQSSKRKQKLAMKHLEQRIERLEGRLGLMEDRYNHHFQQRQQQHQQNQQPSQHQALDSHLTGFTRGASSSSPRALKTQQQTHAIGELLDGVTSPARVPFYYAICSGIIGSMTVLLAKCSAEMIRLSLQGQNQFHYPLTYVFLGGMFVFIVIQTHFLNMATALGDIMTVFPIFQACWISFSVIGGAIFYNNEDSFSPKKWAGYPLALLSIAVGVLLLVQHTTTVSTATPRGTPRGSKIKADKGKKSRDAPRDAIDVRQISDASMRSPLLDDHDDVDEGGYLHLEA